MMGTRGPTNGDEWDAFSRRSRALLHWRPGQVKKVKRGFAKKMRLIARKAVRKELDGQARP